MPVCGWGVRSVSGDVLSNASVAGASFAMLGSSFRCLMCRVGI